MTATLSHAGLAPSDLLTLSELPDLENLTTRWLLVDHNAPTGQLRNQKGAEIVGCIDHHADEDVIAKDAATRFIEQCGSCMSLVVRDAKATWEEFASESKDNTETIANDEKLAKLALAPILIDTANLASKDKVKPQDTDAVHFLEGLIQDESFDRTRFFDAITEVKADISQLSLRDIFRKDYKEWHDNGLKLGISSVVQNLDYLISTVGSGKDEDFLQQFEEWAKERSLDIASVMTTSHDENGQFQRELVFWALGEKGASVLTQFSAYSAEELGLETLFEGRMDIPASRRAWKQTNLAASRKQVAPLLRDAMKQV